MSFFSNKYTNEYEIIGSDGKKEGDARDFGKYIEAMTRWQIDDDDMVMSGKLMKDILIRHDGVVLSYKKDSPVLLYVDGDDDKTKGYIKQSQDGGARRYRGTKSRTNHRRSHHRVRFTRRR